MTSENLIHKIHRLKNQSEEIESDYWKNISISITAIEHCVKTFLITKDPRIAIIYAKSIIMELWCVREYLLALNKSIEQIDREFPDLKTLRDSYAHISERIKGEVKPFNSKSRPLKWENKSFANGALKYDGDGKWHMKADRLFNFKFNGAQGGISVFGLVNNYMVCNTDTKVIEFEIKNEILDRLIISVDACI